MSTYNLCFEQKYEKYQSFLSENFLFLEAKFSIYLNMHVFIMVEYKIMLWRDALHISLEPSFLWKRKHSFQLSMIKNHCGLN